MTRGAQLLRQRLRRHAVASIAVECWTTPRTVEEWAAGRSKPEYAFRRVLDRVYAIPPRAWDEAPGVLEF